MEEHNECFNRDVKCSGGHRGLDNSFPQGQSRDSFLGGGFLVLEIKRGLTVADWEEGNYKWTEFDEPKTGNEEKAKCFKHLVYSFQLVNS